MSLELKLLQTLEKMEIQAAERDHLLVLQVNDLVSHVASLTEQVTSLSEELSNSNKQIERLMLELEK